VPGNGFTFSILVRRQVDVIHRFGGFTQLLNNFFPAFYDNIVRFKIVFNIHSEFFHRQIPHVPHGCADDKVIAQEFIDCLRLCRRLNDNQILCHYNIAFDDDPYVTGRPLHTEYWKSSAVTFLVFLPSPFSVRHAIRSSFP